MKHRRLFRGLLLSVLVVSAALAEVPYSGEDSDFGVARRAVGAGLVDAYTGNLSFQTSDGEEVVYHYEFPEGVDYPVLSTVTYPDETQASYVYAAPRPEGFAAKHDGFFS